MVNRMVKYPDFFLRRIEENRRLVIRLTSVHDVNLKKILTSCAFDCYEDLTNHLFISEKSGHPEDMIYRGEHYSNLQMYTKNIIM